MHKVSCFYNGHRIGHRLGTDWAPNGPRCVNEWLSKDPFALILYLSFDHVSHQKLRYKLLRTSCNKHP